VDGILQFLFFALVLSLLAHGFWVLVRVAFRRLFGRDSRTAYRAEDCARCGESFRAGLKRCPVCGLAPDSSLARELRDLAGTVRQLDRFRSTGAVSPADQEQLLAQVTARRYELTRRKPLPAPATVASPTEAVPAGARVIEVSPAKMTQPVSEVALAPPPDLAVEAPVPVLELVEEPAPPAIPAQEPSPAPSVAADAVTPAPPPRRSLSELLAAFMEQRNILWGELLSGILIVGCSIMLVLHLWKTLEENPVYQFGIFVGVTAALFGAGLYTLNHWKLQTTSRGILIIAALLVPLNFLANAAQLKGAGGWIEISIELVSLAVFVFFLRLVGKVLVPEGRWLFTLAVLGASASQLVVPRALGTLEGGGWLRFFLLGCLPLGCYSLGVGGVLARSTRRGPLSSGQVHSLLALLGIAAFALAVSLGLLAYWTCRQGATLDIALERLAPFLALAGIPILAAGLTIRRRMAEELKEAGMLRTAGSAIILSGVLVMLVPAILAWPHPVLLMVVCALDFAVLTYVAFRYDLAIAHAAALPCLAAAYLTGFHVVSGSVDYDRLGESMSELAFSTQSGIALAGLFILWGVAAEVLARIRRTGHAVFYVLACTGAAAVSMVLVTLPGRGAETAMGLYGLYGVGGLVLNARWRRPLASSLALALLVAATLWGLWGFYPRDIPLWGAVLAVEALAMGCVARAMQPRLAGSASDDPVVAESASAPAGLWEAYREPLARSAESTAPLAFFAAAWAGLQSLTLPVEHVVTGACLALLNVLLAWRYRQPSFTWVGSVLALASIAIALALPGSVFHFPLPSLDVALLAHATLALAGSLVSVKILSQQASEVFARPLRQSALLSSSFALPLLLFPNWNALSVPTLGLFWLAAVWLTIAWLHRRPGLFVAAQVVLCAAVLFATTIWLQHQEWFARHAADLPERLWDPRCLHAFGVSLGVLSLLWVIARLALREREAAQPLLQPPWPAIDRLVLTGLVMGQIALAAWGVAASLPFAHGSGAWLLLGLLTAVLATALWDRRGEWAVVGLVILGLTVPILTAGAFSGIPATELALRWGLAVCFLVLSVCLWLRGSLDRLAVLAGWKVQGGLDLPAVCRALLILCAVLPVLLLTVTQAPLRLGRVPPVWPMDAVFFRHMDWLVATVVPMILLGLGLVGHAFRERSPGYAFAAGLVVNMTATGAYALHSVTVATTDQSPLAVRLMQIATITASLWAIAWLAVRAWYGQRRESPLAQPLLRIQIGMGILGNVWVIGPGLWFLVFLQAGPWTQATGSLLGWCALDLTAAAVFLRIFQSQSGYALKAAGWFGLSALALLACNVEQFWPGLGYRALLLGWAGYPLCWIAAVWWHTLAPERTAHNPLLKEAAFWVRTASVLGVLLSVKAAVWHEEHLWAAGALALACPAAAVMALWYRREDWAFAAGLGVNWAASLIVWHFHHRPALPLEKWTVPLLQGNVIAASLVALLWLGLRRRLYDQPSLSVRSGPYLAFQVAALLVVSCLLMCVPAVALLLSPGPLNAPVLQIGNGWGGLALVLSVAVAAWYVGQVAPDHLIHVLGGVGLTAGAFLAAAIGRADGLNWPAHHGLIAVWMGASFGNALVSRIAERWRAAKDAATVQAWVVSIAVLALIYAVRGAWTDPSGPYWPGCTAFTAAVLFGLLVFRFRQPNYVYASGLTINLLGLLVWVPWGVHTLDNFACVQALCFALASGFWTALDLVLSRKQAAWNLHGSSLPFAHLGAMAATAILALTAVSALTWILAGQGGFAFGVLPWIALAATVAALLLCLWDATARFTPAGFYTAGLVGIGLALLQPQWPARDLLWAATPALAGYIVLCAGMGWGWTRSTDLRRTLHLPSGSATWLPPWFVASQVAGASLVLGLSLWLTLDFPDFLHRLVGPLAVAVLVPAGVWMASRVSPWQNGLRAATLAVGAVTIAEAGWALLDPAGHGATWLWLHRNVLLMVALALMTLLYGVILARRVGLSMDWADACRQTGPVLGVLASALVPVILVQEAVLYDGHKTLVTLVGNMLHRQVPEEWRAGGPLTATPMEPAAIVVVALALAALMVAGLSFAVIPGKDPFGVSERGRMMYVYGAEVLLVLMFVHWRITVPALFRQGIFIRYWPFILMAIAFGGAGLSEYFHRRGLRVLAVPLERTGVFLPMLPVLAFWVLPPGNYALLWFTAGLLYAFVSVTRRSFTFAVLAALAANMGLWVLLHHFEVRFLQHPQAWLIPIAVIALVAEHWNRDQLAAAQSAGLRYLALSVIYVSSTADMFIGMGQSIVLPLVLAVLSILGVLAGMVLQVRAFLFLGVTFLFVVVISMIWHVGINRNQTWILWASGIVLGVGLLILFGIFEKRRNEVIRLVEELKQWD
jgi:hypothetical protein